MKETEFNLLDEGWILARKDDCTVDALSLTDAILRSHEYSGLSGELPTQDVSVLRLMLAVLHTVFSRYSPDGEYDPPGSVYAAVCRWSELWQAGRFPEKPIRDYLESWHERFWLFHPERPFYQVVDAGKEKTSADFPVAKLNSSISESNNKIRLFSSRSGEEKQRLAYPEAARWLLHINSFDDGSNERGKGTLFPPNIGVAWLGTLGVIYAQGNSLFETLMLNLIIYDTEHNRLWDDEMPVWEKENVSRSPRVLISPPTSLSALYTLQSRRTELLRENGFVTGCRIYGGDHFDRVNYFTEPMTVWGFKKPLPKVGEPETVPKTHDRASQMWREFSSCFTVRNEKGVVSNKIRRPGTVEWVTKLKRDGSRSYIDRNRLIRFRICSVEYDGMKSCFVNVFSDSITFRTDLLTELGRRWQKIITEEVGKCEDLAKKLGFFAKDLELAAGASTETAGDNSSVTGAKERFYYEIDIPFREWLEEIDPEWENDSAEERAALEKWHGTAVSAALRIGRELVASAGTAATVGRYIKDSSDKERFYSSADAFRDFRYQIGKIYPKKNKPKEKQT